jgi:hypothetical protein
LHGTLDGRTAVAGKVINSGQVVYAISTLFLPNRPINDEHERIGDHVVSKSR